MSDCSSALSLPRFSSATSSNRLIRYLVVLGICLELPALYIRSTTPMLYLLDSIERGRKRCFLSIGGRVFHPPTIPRLRCPQSHNKRVLRAWGTRYRCSYGTVKDDSYGTKGVPFVPSVPEAGLGCI